MTMNGSPVGVAGPPPVLLVHGLWLHARSWQPWVEYMSRRGRRVIAPGWPDEPPTVAEARADPERAAGHGIEDVVTHYAVIAAGLSPGAVAIGHSLGGLVARRLLADGHVRAAVAISGTPARSRADHPLVILCTSSVTLHDRRGMPSTVILTRAGFREVYGHALTESESDALFESSSVPAPGRLLRELMVDGPALTSPTGAGLGVARGPLLLVAGGRDRTVPPRTVRAVHRLHRLRSAAATDLIEFRDRGHSLTIDHGWAEVARAIVAWLDKRGL